jgi:anti-sigma-K factor RskA
MQHADAIIVPVELRAGMLAEATLAVAIEPVGGSPTGAPTGDVIAKGTPGKIDL